MRKLVKLDAGGWLTEIDLKAMRREALALQAYIEAAPEGEEKLFQYRKKVLPSVCAALEDTKAQSRQAPSSVWLKTCPRH